MRGKNGGNGILLALLLLPSGPESEEPENFRQMFTDTSPWLLGLTLAVTIVHTLIDVLAFRHDILFWKSRQSMEGLSAKYVAGVCGRLEPVPRVWLVLRCRGRNRLQDSSLSSPAVNYESPPDYLRPATPSGTSLSTMIKAFGLSPNPCTGARAHTRAHISHFHNPGSPFLCQHR